MKKNAFTLAEVLITLGIIGVVAALTMPSLIANTQEKQTVVKLKKTYSVLDNAMRLAINDQGSNADGWGLVYSQPQAFTDILMPYLNKAKMCGTIKTGCFSSDNYSSLTGEGAGFGDEVGNNFSKFMLNDGTSVAVWMQPIDPYLGAIIVDLNGKKGPNVVGKDVFWFDILPDKIAPSGLQADTGRCPFKTACNLTSHSSANGRCCTGWVIMNENMDYLHCNDLDWDTKTKCN